MIAYIEGRLLKKDEDRILLLANQVGYEIMVPIFVRETLNVKQIGDEVALYIYYHQTERQPKPVLIGFNLEAEKEFFQHFITVDAIGPIKAVKAMTISVREIADAIESNNLEQLKRLKGIGLRTAQKIIATLQGKMGKFTMIRKTDKLNEKEPEDFVQPVMEVLVNQLGHKPADAKHMIELALKRNGGINSPEELFEEVYRGEKRSV
ncbi:MAG: helix-hairpin-helix domain-containing protein [Desulfobacteraceae bacterium]|nr:helix-hairpin-helix domain-containing protein [Desulfobacteraceae bacterium]